MSDEPHIGADAFAPGSRFGRFEIVRTIGEGGMGVVYEARDRQLDRSIALKVLRDGTGGGAKDARLLREAQALAQLAHPNVVAVHEVGAVDGRVFLAMEYVDGVTFEALLRGGPRPWRELLGLFVQAARGLVAAHARHIVHRDFKPSNVLVDTAGRVRVSDFGLARTVHDLDARTAGPGDAAASAPSGETLSLDGGSGGSPVPPSPGLLGAPLTAEGTLVGTPRYMAPEQRAGRAVTEKSDQFSFCVAFWEALYRQHPFDGAVEAVPSSRQGVPRRLVRTLQRGLALQPEARHSSMAALLAILEHTPVFRRRAVTLALGVLAVSGAAAATWLAAPAHQIDPRCTRDLAGEIWNPASRQALWKAFDATRKPDSHTVAARVDAALDRRVRAWSEAKVAACAVKPAALARRQLVCLDCIASRLQALLDVWQRGPLDLDRAVAAASRAGELIPCTGAGAPAPSADDPRVVRTYRVLDEADELRRLGSLAPAAERAAEAVTMARAINEPALLAEALDASGQASCDQGMLDDGLPALREAVRVSGQALDDTRQAEALIDLIFCLGERARRDADARALVPAAEAAVARIPGREDLRARLLGVEGTILRREGRYAEAVDHLQRAAAITEARLGPDADRTLVTLANLASALADADRKEEARAIEMRVLAACERLFGERHPRVVGMLVNLMIRNDSLGNTEQAAAHGERALKLAREVMPPDHPFTVLAMTWLARQRDAQDRFDEGRALFEEAIAGGARRLGADHPEVARTRVMATEFLDNWGDHAGAEAQLARAIAAQRRTLPDDNTNVLYSRLALCAHLYLQGDLVRARAACEESAAAYRKRSGHARLLAEALVVLADVSFDQGRRAEAGRLATEALASFDEQEAPARANRPYFVAHVARSLIDAGKATEALPLLEAGVVEAAKSHPLQMAFVRFQLARATWQTGDRKRARTLALEARSTYAARRQPQLAGVDRWLRGHRSQ